MVEIPVTLYYVLKIGAMSIIFVNLVRTAGKSAEICKSAEGLDFLGEISNRAIPLSSLNTTSESLVVLACSDPSLNE
jgi:hypothetical protein